MLSRKCTYFALYIFSVFATCYLLLAICYLLYLLFDNYFTHSIDLPENWVSNEIIAIGSQDDDLPAGFTFYLHCMKLFDLALTYDQILQSTSSSCYVDTLRKLFDIIGVIRM